MKKQGWKAFAGALFLAAVLLFSGCDGKEPEMELLIPEDLTIGEEDICYEEGIRYMDSQLLLVVKEGTDYTKVEKLIKQAEGEIIGYISFSGDYQIDFPGGKTYDQLTELVKQWGDQEYVETVSLNKVFRLDTSSVDYHNDPWKDTTEDVDCDEWDQNFPDGNNWWAEAIHMPQVWEMDIWETLTGEPVKLGVLDSGFDLGHEDLDEVVVNLGYNAAQSSAWDHGTHVAGLIAAEMDNGTGIAGVAACADPQLYTFSVMGFNRVPNTNDITIKYAIALMLKNGVKAINISMGFEELTFGAQMENARALAELEALSNSLGRFFRSALDCGYDFLLVAAAGNESGYVWIPCAPSSDHPYGYRILNAEDEKNEEQECHVTYNIFGAIEDSVVKEHMLIVGAAAQGDFWDMTLGTGYERAFFSNLGCDIYAPGAGILSLYPGTTATEKEWGTSQAAPIVTGVAGLVWAVNPELSAQQVRQILLRSAVSGTDNKTGWKDNVPIINAAVAVDYALSLAGEGNGKEQDVTQAALTGYVYAFCDDTGQAVIEEHKEHGIPIIDTPMTITASDGTVTELTTSQWGSFDIFLPPGEYTISVESPGYWPYEATVVLEEGDAVYCPVELSYMPVVSDAYHYHARKDSDGYYITYYIPRVNLYTDRAASVNDIIYQDLSGYVKKDSPQYPYDRGMDYRWTQYKDIISILVRTAGDFDTGMIDFYVYNVSAETGDRLSHKALWEAYGMTEAEYYEQLRDIVKAFYAECYAMWQEQESFYEYTRECEKTCLSNENLEAAMPYVDENGDLCVVMKFYYFAGPPSFYRICNLTGTEEPEELVCELHEDRCLAVKDQDAPYDSFLANGCYTQCLSYYEMAEGYKVLDVNGDGRQELLIEVFSSIPEFHSHRVFTVNKQGQIQRLTENIDSYQCLAYSKEYGALGYFYPRPDAMTSLYHGMKIEDDQWYEAYVLYREPMGDIYKVWQYDADGNEIFGWEDGQDQYEAMMNSFQQISWDPLP